MLQEESHGSPKPGLAGEVYIEPPGRRCGGWQRRPQVPEVGTDGADGWQLCRCLLGCFAESRAQLTAAFGEVTKSACLAVARWWTTAFVDSRGSSVHGTHEFQSLHGQGVREHHHEDEGACMYHQTHVVNVRGMIGNSKYHVPMPTEVGALRRPQNSISRIPKFAVQAGSN